MVKKHGTKADFPSQITYYGKRLHFVKAYSSLHEANVEKSKRSTAFYRNAIRKATLNTGKTYYLLYSKVIA